MHDGERRLCLDDGTSLQCKRKRKRDGGCDGAESAVFSSDEKWSTLIKRVVQESSACKLKYDWPHSIHC